MTVPAFRTCLPAIYGPMIAPTKRNSSTLFTDDALVVGKGKTYRGKAAILGWFRYLIGLREREGDDIWMHEAGQFRFIPAGRAASSMPMRPISTRIPQRPHAACAAWAISLANACKSTASGSFAGSASPHGTAPVPWKKPLPWATCKRGHAIAAIVGRYLGRLPPRPAGRAAVAARGAEAGIVQAVVELLGHFCPAHRHMGIAFCRDNMAAQACASARGHLDHRLPRAA